MSFHFNHTDTPAIPSVRPFTSMEQLTVASVRAVNIDIRQWYDSAHEAATLDSYMCLEVLPALSEYYTMPTIL